MNNKELLYKKLNALRLEVDSSIIDDIKSTVDILFQEQTIGNTMLADGWHSTSERPLYEQKDGYWISTEDGAQPFLAAVDTNKGWWIRHCMLEDDIGLCVVGDDDNESAGWDISDVGYWMPLPPPPTVS